MKIHRILNNNVVIVLTDKEQEKVVCGRGIAFKKKIGDDVLTNQINKVFLLENNQMNQKFQDILAEIPLEVIEVTDDIISYAKANLGDKLNDSIFISLVDHIHTAVVRFKEGITLTNMLLMDIKRFYADEFEIAVKALEMINQKLGVKLPIDEAGSITLHFVNAKMNSEVHNVYQITKIMKEISQIVKYFFEVDFNEENVYYYRFITHLKFFAQRIVNHEQYDDDDRGLLELVSQKYQNSYNCVLDIEKFIEQRYSYAFSNEEKAYLTIHIERVIYKTQKNNNS